MKQILTDNIFTYFWSDETVRDQNKNTEFSSFLLCIAALFGMIILFSGAMGPVSSLQFIGLIVSTFALAEAFYYWCDKRTPPSKEVENRFTLVRKLLNYLLACLTTGTLITVLYVCYLVGKLVSYCFEQWGGLLGEVGKILALIALVVGVLVLLFWALVKLNTLKWKNHNYTPPVVEELPKKPGRPKKPEPPVEKSWI